MRTLGLSSPSPARTGKRRKSAASESEEGADAAMSGGISESGVVLVGGVGDGGSSAEATSSEEEPLAQVVAATQKTTRRRKTTASPASNAKPGARRVAPPSSSDDDSPDQPTTPTKRRRRSISAVEPDAKVAAAPVDTLQPPMPDYASMTVATLQREVAKYGFRKAKEKAVLVRQMQDIWRATHVDAAPTSPSPKKSKAATVGKKRGGAVPSSPPKTGAKGRRKKKDVGEGDEVLDASATDEEGVPVAEKIRQLIMADEELYLRILRYEVRSSQTSASR